MAEEQEKEDADEPLYMWVEFRGEPWPWPWSPRVVFQGWMPISVTFGDY